MFCYFKCLFTNVLFIEKRGFDVFCYTLDVTLMLFL